MEKVKVLIVEDELIIAESIGEMLEEMDYEVIDKVNNAEEAIELIESESPDLVLLDINLKGDKNGIWLGKKLRDRFHLPFLYLTSHGDQPTISAAAATLPYGYILKPIDQQALYAGVQVALVKFAAESAAFRKPEEGDAINKSVFLIKDALFVKDEYQFIKVPFSELLFIKAQGNYIEPVTDGKKQLIKGTLKDIASSLPENSFFQIHRSYIINLNRIDSIGFSHVQLGQHQIPLGKDKREALIEHLQRYS